MKLELVGHTEQYAVEQLMLSLFPEGTEGVAVSSLRRGKKWLTAVAEITVDGVKSRRTKRLAVEQESVKLRRQVLQQSFYLAALPFLEEIPAWGALSGVRPTKLTTRHLLDGGSPASAKRLLEKVYYVEPLRQSLAVDCSLSTVAATKLLDEKDISLYIGIPFCPTRCSYCSFVSKTIGRKTELLAPYLAALFEELELTGQLLRENGYRVRTLYIGGGTPTTLDEKQLQQLMEKIRAHLDLSGCLEFTVEGGRPDTLNLEKLKLLRQLGADRISINPQSMVNSVLAACGRPHTREAVLESYSQAKDAGFENINMDLIAGLPTDTYGGFCHSLDTVAELNPSNITVHTLALKKGADLFQQRQNLPAWQEVARMVDYSREKLSGLSYKPYYLYRQKYMSGSFENVGWSRDNLDCLYNIYMMEEVHTVLSVGGGGMNKVNLPGGRLERFPNPKFPDVYIQQLQSVLDDKEKLFSMMKGGI